ncbi:MAG: hypothetical protein HFE62_02875 [Firmicutes bacterium]|nr:hypothetical protein [Bacillota bacterium]
MKSYFERIIEFIKSRLFIMMVGVFLLFFVIVLRLFSLQVVNGEQYQQALTVSVQQELSIPASRGIIYDRYGRPLATNQVAFSVKLDDSIKVSFSDKSYVVKKIISRYENDDVTITDNLPITETKPRSFTFESEAEEKRWKSSIGLKRGELEMTADEVMEYISDKYDVPDDFSEKDKRRFLSCAVGMSDKNLMIMSLVNILDENGETISDDIPISQSWPHVFLFDGNESRERDWKESMGMKGEQLLYTADETMEYLYGLFEIPNNLSSEMRRKIAAIRYSLYLVRYRKYQPVTVSVNISGKTVAAVEENNQLFPGVTIDTTSLRNYPAGKYFSHILGCIRKISDVEFEQYEQYGYSTEDIIGKSGVERLYELQLNGVDGEMMVEVDASGRRINTIETKQPVSGNNVFLSIDEKLQKAAYDYLEDSLTNVLISKLRATSLRDSPISLKEFFSSLIRCNTISLNSIMEAESGEQLVVKNFILSEQPELLLISDEDKETAKNIVINGINNGSISSRTLITILIEQGKVTADADELERIQSGRITPLSFVIGKLQSHELTPADTDLDPSSGSVVVSSVEDGGVLALVTYPSYDNNRFVNNFDNDYYYYLLEHPMTPMVNRPLTQKKAPGSTFKMITALACLETGVITPTTLIQDLGLFTKAKTPYARCWIYSGSGRTHQRINVATAIEVSCNYFFYEAAFRMGNQEEGTTMEGIASLNRYMEAFGLNTTSGIEIGDATPNMASPKYKEENVKWQNPDATTSQTRWSDGDTIRAAIGQSVNNYAAIHMNKYIATLANGGTRYTSHIINKVETFGGETVEEKGANIEEVTHFAAENLEVVHKGMLLVTQGGQGTLRAVFSGFPIDVAAKSGTAQENLSRSSHTWFTGFAPYDEPQIAVTVMIPFGETSSAPAAVVAREIIGEYMGLNYEPKNSYMQNSLAQ